MSTSTYDELRTMYETHKELDWCEVLAHHLYSGHVICGDDWCIIGEEISGGWFIHTAIGQGRMHKFVESMPYALPWVGWARDCGEVVWHRTDRVLRTIHMINNKRIEQQLNCRLGGSALAPPKPPAAPSRQQAAADVTATGKSVGTPDDPRGAGSTLLTGGQGVMNPKTSTKTLLGF